MWWKSKRGFWELSILSLPKRPEALQLFPFFTLLVFSLWKVEREEAFLYFEDEGLLEVLVEGPVVEEGGRLRLRAKVLSGDFPELYGKKISLSLYGAEDVPSRAFWLYGKVRAEGNKVFVSASWKDIEGPSLRQKSLRERYMGKVEEKIKDPQVRALTLSYLFGESQELLPQDIFYHFRKTGLIHILVISGFHVAMFFFILKYALPYPYGVLLATIGTSLYVIFLTPQDPPALRAWLMFLLWVLVKLSQGVPNSLNILLFSCSLLLLFEPSFVRSYSFWLSFFATLYILLGLRIVRREENSLKWKVLNSFLLSFFAFLGVSPLLWSFTTSSAGYYLRSIVNVGAYGSLMDFLSYAMFLYAFFLSYKLVKTQRKEMGKRYLDPMTGLFNRLYLEEVLPRRIEAILTLGLNYLTIFLDIDNLKQVNDTYGHLKGDELIKNLAKAINQSIRGHEDVAIRYGGDEFLIVAPIRACGDSLILLERIERNIEEMNQSLEIPLSVSIGFACYPDDEKDFRKLLEVADKRMYQIKVDRKGFSST